MRNAYLKEEVIPQLWAAYRKTSEYKLGLNKAIYEDNPLIRTQEKEGLQAIYSTFVSHLSSYTNQKEILFKRDSIDWLREWKSMHKLLYGHILLDSGNWRKKEVRFGNPGDEELYKIPNKINVSNEITSLAEHMQSFILQIKETQSYFSILAQFHYSFIRIHPFNDGNEGLQEPLLIN
ncbi:MAG TPA: Fic family protein [Patescibacteria group bacterium]|nr:Fic family protein [Patescibacteria group bacterium]